MQTNSQNRPHGSARDPSPPGVGTPGIEAHAASADVSVTDVEAERRRLNARVAELEGELDEERQKSAALKSESAELRQMLSAWAWQQVTPEELELWDGVDEEGGVSFAELLQAFEQAKEP